MKQELPKFDAFRSESNLQVLTDQMVNSNKSLLQRGLNPYPEMSWNDVRKAYRAQFSGFQDQDFIDKEENGELTLALLKGGYNPSKDVHQKVIFDRNGRCIQQFDTVGNTTINYEYDENGRLLTIKYESASHGYDSDLSYNRNELIEVLTQFWSRDENYQKVNWGGLLTQSKK